VDGGVTVGSWGTKDDDDEEEEEGVAGGVEGAITTVGVVGEDDTGSRGDSWKEGFCCACACCGMENGDDVAIFFIMVMVVVIMVEGVVVEKAILPQFQLW